MYKLFNLFLVALISLTAHSQNLLPSAVNLLPDNYGVFTIQVLDANTVWATGANFNNTSPVSTTDTVSIVKTTDGGATWRVKKISNFPGNFPLHMFALNDDTAFVALNAFDGTGGFLIRTNNGGNTWTSAYSGTGSGLWVQFFNDLDGVCLNTGAGATTNDGGLTWQVIPSSNIPAFLPGEFNLVSSGNNSCVVKGNSIWFGTNKGRVFRSNDKGKNWSATTTSLGSTAQISSLAFRDSLIGIAVDVFGSTADLSISSDGGKTWSTQTVLTPIPINNVEYVEGTDSTFISTSSFNKSYLDRRAAYSKDFGKTWTIINSFIPFGGVDFISPTIGFMGSVEYSAFALHDTLIYKWNSSVLVGVNELYPKIDLTVYPNPFIDFVNFDIGNKNIDIKKIEVFDNSGSLCTQIIPLSINNYQIDLSGLNPGIYQVVMHTNQGRLVKKIIKPQ